jgi:predicted dehydrogenase
MSEHVDRRHFLAAGAATGVALGVAGQAQAQNQNQNQDSESDQLVVGVMGTGGRGTGLARAYQQLAGVRVAYCCDADQERAERAAGEVQKISNRAPRVVTDFRRILDDRDVNILVVAAPNHWHAPAAILACAAGKHVYVEKPCSHNPREGELLVQAARKHNRKVQMGNQRRSWPAVIEAIEEIKKGTLGRVYQAEAWYTANRPSIGTGKAAEPPKGLDYDLWQGPAPRRPFRSNYLHYNWHWFWHWGNGELGNNGVHSIDLCRWGLGVDYPIRVTSSGGRYRFQDDQETPDTHTVCYEFDGRKQIVWQGWSCNRIPSAKVDHVRFHGERGSLSLNDDAYTIFDTVGKEVRRVPVRAGDAVHFNNFLAAIRGNVRLNSEIEEGHKSTLLCHLGNIAQRTGRSLRCDPRNGSIQGDKEAMAFWTREYEKGWEPRV